MSLLALGGTPLRLLSSLRDWVKLKVPMFSSVVNCALPTVLS